MVQRRWVRVVRRNHPLFLVRVPLVEFWAGATGRWVVIELPDGSHARIPSNWVDDGAHADPGGGGAGIVLTTEGAREFASHARSLWARRGNVRK